MLTLQGVVEQVKVLLAARVHALLKLPADAVLLLLDLADGLLPLPLQTLGQVHPELGHLPYGLPATEVGLQYDDLWGERTDSLLTTQPGS